MIKQFRSEYPYIEIKLMEGGYLEIEQWIEAGVVDCGFISLPTREKAGIKPNIKFSAGDDYAIMAMMEMGLGISIFPGLVLKRQNYNVTILN